MSTSGPIKANVHTLACQRGHTTKQRRQDIFIKDRKAAPFNFTIIVFGNRWRHLLGEIDFWDRSMLEELMLHWLHPVLAKQIHREILLICCTKYVPYGAAVTDLYAGAGVIRLSLAATRKRRQELGWFKSTKRQSYLLRRQLAAYQCL
ncbi:unnamed protein product, partial [Vitis vinifera]|uniref:Uncharacterized protein n=1 Tax=Vitis vinifera TaxID=29760 RepID=D7UE48_VITVI